MRRVACPGAFAMARGATFFAAAAWLAPAFAASADEHAFVTSAGVRVETPPVTELDCEAMAQVLRAIDGSGYRRGAPTPLDAADEGLRRYENRVARRHYAECLLRPATGDPGAVLQDGFASGRARDSE